MFKTFFVILIYLHSASFQLLSVNIAEIFLNHTDQSSYNNNYDFYIPRGNNSELDTFSWNFFKTVLINETNHNVFLSPFSVKLTLAILLEAAGANSETQKELQKSQTIMNTEILRQHYKNTLTKLQQQNANTKFNLQTKIFTDEFINPQQRYGAILQNYYNTEIQSINFKNPKTAAFLINDWCNNASNGQIQKIVSEETIQNNILILANVIYFKGLWMHEFNETFEGIFFKGIKNSTRATYMEQTGNFYYLNSEQFNCKVLRLPYKDNSFSMFIILPNNEEDIDKSTSFLSAITINQLQWLLEERKVKVNLPKFKIQFSKSLKDSLNYLGVGEIFMNSASLPGLARGGDVAGRLKVTNIIQTAGVDVNEKGTEASAATVVEVGNKFGGSQTIEEFIVNRSFIFFIEDETRGEILFGGKVIEPKM